MDAMSGLKELMLRAPRLTLAAAESLTCGRVQARMGAMSGASEFFLGGITAYTLDQKVRHLGVIRAEAAAVNSVSAGVAEQMAQGACRLFGSDLAVATTGYAEVWPAEKVTQPFAWWALAHRGPEGNFTLRSARVDCPDATRIEVQEQVADAVMTALVDYLRAVRR